jgi:DNA polymerase I
MASEKKRRLVLLDTHAILHRAYHALPDFTSGTGEPTGALYGLIAMLIKIIQELKPDYLVACYDLPGPTYRHAAFEDYKATRVKPDEALIKQIERSRDVLDALSIPLYEHAGFEADDMLGTIVEQVAKNYDDVEVVIASGDMDTLQLVLGKRVRVYTLRKGMQDTVLYDERAVEERFGFLPKLLTDFKGLRGDPSDNIPGIRGIGEKTATELILKFGSLEALYKTLKKRPKALQEAGIKPRVVELIASGEEEALFSKMLATIRRDAPILFTLPAKPWREALNVEKALALFSELSFRTLSDRLRSLFQDSLPVVQEKRPEVTLEELAPVAVALWLLTSDTTNPTLEDVLAYARTKDFSVARERIMKELGEAELTRVYEDIERPLIPVVSRMQERGIAVDVPYLRELSSEYHVELAKREKKIFEAAGMEFNINSPKQLGEVLFEKMALMVKNHKKTSTGKLSTREAELQKLRDVHPIIDDILSYRELQKLLSTYIDNLPSMVDASGRLHAAFVQAGTTTGRMSSQSPNLQNIPIRTELGRNIRKAFVAGEGFTLAAFDYSQIELRVAAFLSGDEKLISIFKGGGDVHGAVAAQVFNVPPEHVDSEMRRRAKVINFGILYGMGVSALKENLGTTRTEAQDFYNQYFKNFAGLARYLDDVRALAARQGYTTTYFGRRRHFPAIRSPLPYLRAEAERMAINAPIQGTEADIIKRAMVLIDALIQKDSLSHDVHLLLQVHDELVYEIKTPLLKEVVPRIARIMERVLTLKETSGVPILVEPKVGARWGELTKFTS